MKLCRFSTDSKVLPTAAVEVVIEGIGVLRNQVARATA